MNMAVYIMNGVVALGGVFFYILGILGRHPSVARQDAESEPKGRRQLELLVGIAIAVLCYAPYLFISWRVAAWDTFPLRSLSVQALLTVYFGALYGVGLFELGKRIRLAPKRKNGDAPSPSPNSFE